MTPGCRSVAPSSAAPGAFLLHERVALVTGALGLLGRQHCDALAEAGAAVVVSDLDGHSAEAMATELSRHRRVPALGIALDVTNPDSLRESRDAVVRKFGRLDVLVNNAGVNDRVEAGEGRWPFEEYPLKEWNRLMAVNATGTFLACQVFGSAMAEAGSGSIVNVASTYGLVAPDPSLYRRADGVPAFFKSPAYPASKGAVIALTRYLAAHWGEAGVRVNALCPGGVQNGQDEEFRQNYSRKTPLGRLACPSDYRGALVFLSSRASAYMTGACLVVDGGFTAW